MNFTIAFPFLLSFLLFQNQCAPYEEIDNNFINLKYLESEDQYIFTLSGYHIENSNKKCALQYYDHAETTLKIIPNCNTNFGDKSEDQVSNMCIYDCRKVVLKINSNQFKNYKFLKWCQGKDREDVKICKHKRVFKIKGIFNIDVYVKSVLTATKINDSVTVNIKNKINRGFSSIYGLSQEKSEESSDVPFETKTINMGAKMHYLFYAVKFKNNLPEIFMNPQKPTEDWFIATGSKETVSTKYYYTIKLQNSEPSQLCYFGIKEIHETHFYSSCSDFNKAGPCIQPCFQATLLHDKNLNFAQIMVKVYRKLSSKEFIQTITFGNNQGIATPNKDQATIDLSSLNKNEGSDSEVKSASITEIKLIRKYLGIESIGEDPTCSGSGGCKTFGSNTITNLSPLTEYILRVKINGLNTLDSPEVNYYHRYINFKTKGETFDSSKQIAPTAVPDEPTKLSLTPSNLFTSGTNANAKCGLYYSVGDNEESILPATCQIEGKNKFCFDSCTKTFNIVNLDPKTRYKIIVCSEGYTCERSSNAVETSGDIISTSKTGESSSKKTQVTMAATGGGNLKNSWAYMLADKKTKKIIFDCLNSPCDPSISTTMTSNIEIPWTSFQAEVLYEVVVIDKNNAKPVSLDITRGVEESTSEMILTPTSQNNKYKVKFSGDILTIKDKQCTVKKSSDNLLNYDNAGENSTQKSANCISLNNELEISLNIENSHKYISVTYEDSKEVEESTPPPSSSSSSSSSISSSSSSSSPSLSSPPTGEVPQEVGASEPTKTKKTIKFNRGKVYSYFLDYYEEITHIATLNQDNIKLSVSKNSLECKAYKDEDIQTNINEVQESGSPTFGSYSIPFGELVKDYHIRCPTYFDFHYFYDNYFVTNNAPVFNRFYYKLTNDEENKKISVQLVNDKPSKMCTFEWQDATTKSSKQFFSNTCNNNKNCYLSTCKEFTFGNIPNSVKAVKIRVLELGMQPIIGYQSNIYILKQGSDTQVATANNNISINISSNNKDEEGATISNPAVECSLSYWNAHAPLVSENERKTLKSPSACTFTSIEITPDPIDLPNDIMVTITKIPNYSPRKYFFHKTSQSNSLSDTDITVTSTADGFKFTPSSTASSAICSIFVKESDSKNDYFQPAICTGGVLCENLCTSAFTLIGLYSGMNYNIKIVPSKNYQVKIFETQKTSGEMVEFEISSETKKNSLIITPKTGIQNTDCYYHLKRHELGEDSPTSMVKSCIGCIGNDLKKCNAIQFSDGLYNNKYNYRLMIYATGKSPPFKITIPAFSRHGKLHQNFVQSTGSDVEKFSVKLSEFPSGSKCVIKWSNFAGTPEYVKPTCSSKSSGDHCIMDCPSSDFSEIDHLNSKVDRYMLVCYGSDENKAKNCKKATVFSIHMNYKLKNNYAVTHVDNKVSLSYKSNSKTEWKVTTDEQDDNFSISSINDFNLAGYTSNIQSKSISISLDRFMKYYKIESTHMWPGIIYYTNNTYLKYATPFKSKIIYSVSDFENKPEKIKIKFSPGPYNDEICHIKVFEIQQDGSDNLASVLNVCEDVSDGCYRLCQDGVIHLNKQYEKIGLIVKRRFDSVESKQYFKRGDTGYNLSSVTTSGVTLSGLNVYPNIKKESSSPVCTIKISRANTISSKTKAHCGSNSEECSTGCEASYTIKSLEAGTTYLISVEVTNLGISGTYIKNMVFRTNGGSVLTASASDASITMGTTSLTPYIKHDSLPICRVYLKKNGDLNKKYMATCEGMGACENKCDAQFKIVNLELGQAYKAFVVPSDGKDEKQYDIVTENSDLSIVSSFKGENGFNIVINFTGRSEQSKCPFILNEKTEKDSLSIVTWCNDDEDCAANKCIINIDSLSKEKDYVLKVKAKDYSKYKEHNILLNSLESYIYQLFSEEQQIRSEYTNIEVDSIIQKVIKVVEKGIDSKEKHDFTAAKSDRLSNNSYILYGMIPILAALLVVIGFAFRRKSSKDFSYDL